MREIAKASLNPATFILVPAAVAVAENMGVGLVQVRPSGLPISARDQTPVWFSAAHACLAPATVHRLSELRTVRNASYCILGLNCGSEDFAQYRKLDSLVKPSISATAGVPYPTRNLMRRRMVPPGRGVAGYRPISRFQHCSGMRSCRCRQPVRLIQRQNFLRSKKMITPRGVSCPESGRKSGRRLLAVPYLLAVCPCLE